MLKNKSNLKHEIAKIKKEMKTEPIEENKNN